MKPGMICVALTESEARALLRKRTKRTQMEKIYARRAKRVIRMALTGRI